MFGLVEDADPNDERVYPEEIRHGYHRGKVLELTNGDRTIHRTVADYGTDDGGQYIEFNEPIGESFPAGETIVRYPADQMHESLGDSKRELEELGFEINTLLTPYDSFDEYSMEFAACDVTGWLGFDDVTVAGSAHFPTLTFGTVQFVSTTFEEGAEFVGADGTRAIFDGVRLDDTDDTLDLSEGAFDLLRVRPSSDLACRLQDATVSEGRLDQPEDAVACYDLTDATLGDVDLDCEPATFDRYRFYRTRFDGFPFASYREVLRANHWRLHEYVGTPAVADSIEGLEHTYLEGKQGATGTGDSETASMFFVRELRYRRRRYAAHARAAEHSLPHCVDAALRWATNGFLDLIAGYGERPQRTLALALAVIVSSALAYPAADGLVAGEEVVRYGTHGPLTVLDGLYFSVVTFATLGLGDVHPAGDIGRFIAASEGLAGAFLTAVFVFSLGRRVTR